MPGDFWVKMILGGLIIGGCVVYAIGIAHHAGKRSGKGASTGLDIPQAIVSILVALGVAFSLGQAFPYVELFDWFHSMMALRQPCC